MAIIIPSKNIYEINNQKVVDNEVDNIEVEGKYPEIISDTKIVYNEKLTSNYSEDIAQSEYANEEKSFSGLGNQTYTAFSYVEEIPRYDTFTITIPKHIGNSGILHILTGANENGDENIKYSLRGITQIGKLTGTAVCNKPVVGEATFENITINRPTNLVIKLDTQYSISPNIEYTFEVPDTVSATEKFTLDNKSNILTAIAQDSPDGENFIIDLTLLSGLIIKKVGGGGLIVLGGKTDISLSGEYEEYAPQQIDISFSGDTISLDLQDETVKIGSGQHVYSFNGNELMQTSNTPTIENTYNKIIRSWKNGKEIATLRCGLVNYMNDFSKTDNVSIQISEKDAYIGLENLTRIVFTCFEDLLSETISAIYLQLNGQSYPLKNISKISSSSYSAAVEQNVDEIDIGDNNIQVLRKGEIVISPNQIGLPMTFHIGDEVIPYVRGADGNDKPMSLYSDKATPKKFNIIGKSIIADGEILQEINLQEIPKE